MYDKAFSVMDRVPGYTLNELTYRRPEILEDNKVNIAFQLGMHTVFSYVFGVRDGYQTNYIFDPVSKILTRIDKERFLELPENPLETLKEGDKYTQEIASCELSNLKYVPSFRDSEKRKSVVTALKAGFLEKYTELKQKKNDLLDLVLETRQTWWDLRPDKDREAYDTDTAEILEKVAFLIDQEPEKIWVRLIKAKIEVDKNH